MTIPSLTAINPAPLAATKTGAPTAQTTATTTDTQVQVTQPQPLVNALDAVLAAARQSAAATQDGLAVLMANALRAAAANALPDAVQKAIDQLLALHLPTDTPPDAQSVKTALQTSGLFTEANLASGATRIPVDVKTALLQLNQAAQAWLARAALATDPKQEAAATQIPIVPVPAERQAAKPGKSATPKSPDTPAAAARPGTPAPPPAGRPMPENSDKGLAPVVTRPVALAPVTVAKPSMPSPAQEPVAEAKAAPVPAAFKPVLELLTQAVDALQPETAPPVAPQKAQANLAQPAAAASPAPRSNAPAATNGAHAAQGAVDANSPPALQPAQIKIAAALVDQAMKSWPAPQAAPSTMPLSMSGSKIAAQAFATAAEEPASLPPAIKAVLVQLEKAVEPYAAPRFSAPSAAETASPGKPSLPCAGPVQDRGATPPERNTANPETPGAAVGATSTAEPTRSTVKPSVSSGSSSEAAKSQSAQFSAPSAKSPAPPVPEVETSIPPQETTLVAPTTSVPAPPTTTAPAAKPAIPNELRALLGILNKVADSATLAQQPAPVNAPEAHSTTPNVPPPAAGAPSKAQGTAASTLPEHADAALIAKSLVSGSDAALARQTLLQIASLPDPAVQNRNGEARWIFDLPVMTDQGAAVAQVIIERDGRTASGDAPHPVWRVQFALDIEPLGPVRANLAISGEHAWVTIGAERPDSLAKLQAQAGTLSDALQSQSLEADIAFQSGAGPQSVRRGKPLVDRAS